MQRTVKRRNTMHKKTSDESLKKNLSNTTKRYKNLYLYYDEIMIQHNTPCATERSKRHVRVYK